MINRQVHLASTPDGVPELEHFAVVNGTLPEPEDGQILCATQYLSLDPYMRSQIAGRHMSGSIAPGELMRGETVSKVLDSKHRDFTTGDLVRGFGNWQQYSVHNAEELTPVNRKIKPESYALSALGMPGLTAYAGLMWIAKPKTGDVVLVPAAIGAVGSTVGQLAKHAGATVIGIAGSEEKCRIATDQLGYDDCINRKQDDLAESLKRICPNGIDVYFDLVGGETLNTVCNNLAPQARVVLCGLMEDYNKSTRTPGPMPAAIIVARATLTGLVVYDWESRRDEFVGAMLPLINSGEITVLEDMAEGIDAAPAAFCSLMRGQNRGKAIVKIAV